MVRAALGCCDAPPATAHAQRAQLHAWDCYVVNIGKLKFKRAEFPAFADVAPVTLGGIPLMLDADVPISEIHFRDAGSKIVGRIVCLPIPCGFKES